MAALAWRLMKDTFTGFSDDELLTRGAAIAYYTVFSMAPVLIIVIAVAGLAFGREAAQVALVAQLSGLMGPRSADLLQAMIESASHRESGVWATVIGLGALLVTASGVFGEMQSSLNRIWKAAPKRSTVSRLVRARLVSLGLVMALGFMLTVSLVVNAGIAALHGWVDRLFPGAQFVLQVLTFAVSFGFTALLFAAIYKILPDTPIDWRDVGVGAVATALLFTIGRTLIGMYIGSSSVTSSYGAAGALAVTFLWIYYSAQIFLLGASFTHAYARARREPAAVM